MEFCCLSLVRIRVIRGSCSLFEFSHKSGVCPVWEWVLKEWGGASQNGVPGQRLANEIT